MNEWITAAIAVAVALLVGGVVRAVVARLLSDERRPEALRRSANSLAGLCFSIIVIVGLLVALGIVDPTSLEQLPENLVAFIPKALSAAILVIGGNIAASFAAVALTRVLAGTPAATQRRAGAAAKVAIIGAALLLAAGQLGVNTTILNLAAAALLFSIGASFTLLSGLGGRRVSAELAAGRAISRMIAAGDEITVDGKSGTVVSMHPTSVELQLADGSFLLVPHSMLLETPTSIRRAETG